MTPLGTYFAAQKPRLEIIPMIDIMMFLLVFFIVLTLKMISGTGIQSNLPSSSTAHELKPTTIAIGIAKDGTMTVGDVKTDAVSLRTKLEDARRSSEVSVVIAGNKEVPLQSLLEVMDIVRSAGINAIGIAARPEGPRPAQ
jgi:biopolymer transport protein ExbD